MILGNTDRANYWSMVPGNFLQVSKAIHEIALRPTKRPQLTETEKDHIHGCHLSRRRLEEDDILRVSRRFGAAWRDVGNSLHFTHAQLDQVRIKAV